MLDELTVLIETWASSSLAVPYIAVPVYMLAGLLSSAFPCVYPLIPITVGFIQNRTQPEESRWKHPLLYWLGTILAYTLLGLIAAAGGGAFNTLMQNGIVILGTAFLFLFLAAVTVDWFPLTWGTGDRLMHRAAGHSGILFTVLMGLAAGFVASACVAPALVTMLLFIAKNAATDGGLSMGGILYGGLLSLSFGVGIGVPFFAAGVAGTRLPKSGGWMSLIKHSFAILIFLFALYQMFKGFSVLGWNAMDIYLILGGVALLLASVLLGLKPPATEDRRALTRFFFALLFAAFAAGLIVRGIGAPGSSTTVTETETIGNLTFLRQREEALAIARQQKKPVFVDFYADWCTNCKDFYDLANSNQNLNAALQQTVLLKIYDTDPEFEEYASDPRYPELQIGLPFFIVLSPEGDFVWKTNNYRDVDGMRGAIERAKPDA